MLKLASSLAEFQKAIDDMAIIPCISCERLLHRCAVVRIGLSDSAPIGERLKAHVIEQNPNSINEQLYICSFCKHHIIDGDLPGRCVLNGLKSVPVPQELECLNSLEKHLIQRAKCFICIVRLKP